MDSLDLTSYRMQAGDALPLRRSEQRVLPRHSVGEWFLKGPIPGHWLQAAARLPGKALHVALAIRHEAQMKKTDTAVLSTAAINRFGIGRQALRQGLDHLEEAGLITVVRRPGCAARATVLKFVG